MVTRLLVLFTLLLAGLTLAPPAAQAAPGDTTRVVLFSNRPLNHYGNYDTTAVLPAAGRYRQIRLHYVLGRYACPPGTQYCGSWDYTTRVLLMPPANDTVELARIITPYATDWLAQNRRHDFVQDVTDYAPLLKGQRSFRFLYDGYSWGFTLTLYLEYIEGVPPHDALAVRNVYNGNFTYGSATDPIDNHLPATTLMAAPGNGRAMLKSFITGHGSDPRNCAEFCRRGYTLKVNGGVVGTTSLWRGDCGLNPVSPQTGTWVYNRSNWCPGDAVDPIYHDLTSHLSANAVRIDIDMPAYTVTNPANVRALWIWQTQFISYSPPNYPHDAALEQIIAPSKDPNYRRDNPICAAPRIILKNTGGDSLQSATIRYRVGTGPWRSYQWQGNLAFLAQTEVTLPAVPADFPGQSVFKVYVTLPNGQADPNHFNDTLSTRFDAPAVLPPALTVELKTNLSFANGVGQSSWTLTDAAGQTIMTRTNTQVDTTYRDALRLLPGCYTLTVDDAGCDGLAWWANAGAGNGYLRLLGANNAILTTINPDFGCQAQLRFTVTQALPTAAAQAQAGLEVYPNPAQDGRFTLDMNLPTRQDVQLRVRSVTGRLVHQATLPKAQTAKHPLDLHGLPSGVYLLECQGQDGLQLYRRLLIP